MANVKIMVDGALMDGHRVTFKAPCDCTIVEKLKVCYVKDGEQKSKLFTMKDSHCNNLTGLGNLFTKGAYVDVILDTNNNVAYLQNAATNRYLEQKMDAAVTNASKVWVLPDGDTLYNFGYGSPQDNGYIAENYRGEAYVDSTTGEVYEVVEIEIVGDDGKFEKGFDWAISDQLMSVQEKVEVVDISDAITLHNGTRLYYAKYCNGKVDIRGVTNVELTNTAFKDIFTISEKYRISSDVINAEGVATSSELTPWFVFDTTGLLRGATKGGTIPANGNVRFNLSYYVF